MGPGVGVAVGAAGFVGGAPGVKATVDAAVEVPLLAVAAGVPEVDVPEVSHPARVSTSITITGVDHGRCFARGDVPNGTGCPPQKCSATCNRDTTQPVGTCRNLASSTRGGDRSRSCPGSYCPTDK